MLRTKDQNKRLHAILGKMGIDRSTDEGREILEQMVYDVTKGRTSSSSKMLIDECQALINNLKAMTGERPSSYTGAVSKYKDDKADKMRKKCLSICREMGGDWLMANGQYNWKKINEWLYKSGYLHKSFNSYTAAELPKLVYQFEKLLETHYAKR